MSDYEHRGPPLHWLDWEHDFPDEDDRDEARRSYERVRRKPGSEPELPQSYSCFVLPFAYSPQPWDDGEKSASTSLQAWQLEPFSDANKPCDAADTPARRADQRQQYFTTETAHVLYQRARRARLAQNSHDKTPRDPAPAETLTLGQGETSFTVSLAAAELILFEWPAAALDNACVNSHSENLRDNDPLLVGLLCRQAHFPPQALQLKHLLAFNDLFRHVREPYSGHRKERFDTLFANTRLASLDNPYFDDWFKLLQCPLLGHDGKRYRLFPQSWDDGCRDWAAGRNRSTAHAMCHPDSRAFVATFAQIRGGADSLLPPTPSQAADGNEGTATSMDEPTCFPCSDDATHAARALHNDASNPRSREKITQESLLKRVHTPGWIALLNIDNPKALSDPSPFEQQWANDHTYMRWAHVGTLYGYTPHSSAVVAGVCLEPPLWHHFGSTYFDQTVLLLYLRTVIFRISQRINAVTARQRDRGEDPAAADEFHALSRQITQFINLYQFPFLSLQQQGVEMYERQRQCMDIDDLYLEVREEVERTQAQLDMSRQIDLAQASHRLGVVATYGIPVGIAALFGVLWNDLGLRVLAGPIVDVIACLVTLPKSILEAAFGVLLATGIFFAALSRTRKLIGRL